MAELNDILSLFHDEELIRFRHRAHKRGLEELAQLFNAEFLWREARHKEEARKDRMAAKNR